MLRLLNKLSFVLAAMLFFGGSGTLNVNPAYDVERAGIDLMIVVAHPGDEYLYLGGVLSNYVTQKKYTALVVYMTSLDETQRYEARAALKKLGVTTEPVFGGFANVDSDSTETIKKAWDEQAVHRFLTSVIRQYRPLIVFSHDLRGEYGNAAHMVTARSVWQAVLAAANTRSGRESYAQYGVWQVKRLFLHLYKGDTTVSINRSAPLSALNNRTAVEVEADLYESFSAQYRYPLDVGDPVYGRADYGLVTSGPDVKTLPQNGDFFSGVNRVIFLGANRPSIVASETLFTDAPKKPEPSEDSYFRSSTDPQEVVIEDWNNEHWEYRTDTLSIIIDRYHIIDAENKPVAYCVAHVRMRKEDAFRAAVRGEEGGTKSNEVPTDMARRYQAVLAITGDNLTSNEADFKGIIIRNGRVYNRQTAMDTMALLPDLSMKIYSPGETTPEKLLDMGVINAFSFGPTLIRDGVVNTNASRHKIMGRNPRVGVGMIKPGHFVVITVDGRISQYSHGMTLNTFMQLFYSLGCKQAYNLDGGSSTAMVFMGEYLNKHNLLEGGVAGMRGLPDMLLWGRSALVPGVDDPVEHSVYYGQD